MAIIEKTKWYQDKDIAFAIGVDEFGVGGFVEVEPKGEYWDSYYWFWKENNFFSKYWLKVLKKFPEIRYSLGLVLDHSSPSGKNKYIVPEGLSQDSLKYDSKMGEIWQRKVLKPLYETGNFDEFVAHGYEHDLPSSHYCPYWHRSSILLKQKGVYSDCNYFERSLEKLQRGFGAVFGHECRTWNTAPFASARPDMPYLFSRNRIYGLGVLLDVSKNSLDSMTGLKKLGKRRTYKRKIGTIIEHEGSLFDSKERSLQKVGDMGYWHQDRSVVDKKGKIIVCPYSVSIENSMAEFKSRINYLLKNKTEFKAPIAYYFMHSVYPDADSLGGSNKLSVKILQYAKFKEWHNVLSALRGFGLDYGFAENMDKHIRHIEWLLSMHRDKVWMTDFTTACQYFDFYTNSKISYDAEEKKIIFHLKDCFAWDMDLRVTLKVDGRKIDFSLPKNAFGNKKPYKIRMNAIR